MDYTELRKTLDNCINKASSFYLSVQEKVVNEPEEMKESLRIHYLSKPVEEILNKLEFYQNAVWFINSNNGSVGFNPNQIAVLLISIALKADSSQSAINWFDKIINTKSASGQSIMLLWGVRVDASVKLNDEISIVPFTDLPNSKNKEWANNDTTWSSNGIHWSLLGKPQCALVQNITISPFIFNSMNEKKNRSSNDYIVEHNRLDEIRLILSVIEPSPVIQAARWFNYNDPDLNYAIPCTRAWHNHEIKLMTLPEYGTFDTAEAKLILTDYISMAEKEKKRIRKAIERLNRAMRRRDKGDSAVELSIALECLFADNAGENTYKIGLRTALLIGGNQKTKIRNRSIISGLYSIRSSVVHNGEAPLSIKIKGGEDELLDSVVLEATKICAMAIKKIILMKKIPDWYDIEMQFDS